MTHSKTPDLFWTGVSLGVLLVFTAANVFVLLFIAPKFGQLYADAVPGMPLPFPTKLIFAGRFAFVALNVGWLSFCIYFARRHRAHTIWFVNVGTIWTFAQVWITIFALMQPLSTGPIVGVSD